MDFFANVIVKESTKFTISTIQDKSVTKEKCVSIEESSTKFTRKRFETTKYEATEKALFANEIDKANSVCEKFITVNESQYIIPLVDYIYNKKLPPTTDIPCHWCRRKFKTCPLGVPINFKKAGSILPDGAIIANDMFITDSIACSFNCIVSIVNESTSALYRNSPYLINRMYYCIFQQLPFAEGIQPAPSWKLRKECGGSLTDEEYENITQLSVVTDTYQTVDLFSPCIHFFEKR